MGRHVARRAGRIPVYWWVVAVVLVLAGVAFGLAATSQSDHPAASSSGTGSSSGASGSCSRQLRVVTATSYEPVLQKAADGIAQGPDCVKVTTTRADGSGAADVVASSGADAWIADDVSWPQLPSTAHIAKDRAQVVATSPLYVVTQRSAAALPASARRANWLAVLAHQRAGRHVRGGEAVARTDGASDRQLAAVRHPDPQSGRHAVLHDGHVVLRRVDHDRVVRKRSYRAGVSHKGLVWQAGVQARGAGAGSSISEVSSRPPSRSAVKRLIVSSDPGLDARPGQSRNRRRSAVSSSAGGIGIGGPP